jgi:hypothetical protein
MSSVEQLVPLTDGDRQVLEDKKNNAAIWTFGAAILAVVLFGLLIVFHSIFAIIMIVVFNLALLTIALTALLKLLAVSKDLRGNQKQMISGPVEAQDVEVTRTKDEDGVEGSATYRWWIQVGGKKITVTEDQYYQFKKGDLAQAFITPNSGTVLGVSKEYARRPFG